MAVSIRNNSVATFSRNMFYGGVGFHLTASPRLSVDARSSEVIVEAYRHPNHMFS